MNAYVVAVLLFSVSVFAQDPSPSTGANVLVTAHSLVPNSNVSDPARVTNATNPAISILSSNETATANESSSSSSTAASVSSASSSDVSTSTSSGSVQALTSSSVVAESNVTIAANADVANVTAQAPEAKVTAPVDAANPAGNVSAGAASSSSSVASTTESGGTTSAPAETRKPVAASPDRNFRPVASGVPGLPQLAPKDQSASPFIAKGTYIKTSAVEKPCKENPDCYNHREPDEWCPLPERSRYSDKGCFCDHVRFVCTIQRQSPKGDDEYTDCAEKSTSVCAGYKPVIRVQQPPQPQPQPAQQQKQEKQEKQEQRPSQQKIKN